MGKLIDQVFVLRHLFKLFTDTATKCAEYLPRRGTEYDPLADLAIPEELVNGSRDAAFDWSDISREIQIDESLERWVSFSKRNDRQKFSDEIKRALKGLEKYEDMAKEFAEDQRRILNKPTTDNPPEPPTPGKIDAPPDRHGAR